MFLLDDILFRALGISIPVFDLFWNFEQIHVFAMREIYNPEKIKNRIKENRLLFEFGELTREEYENINRDLMQDLRMAEMAHEMNLGTRLDLLGGR